MGRLLAVNETNYMVQAPVCNSGDMTFPQALGTLGEGAEQGRADPGVRGGRLTDLQEGLAAPTAAGRPGVGPLGERSRLERSDRNSWGAENAVLFPPHLWVSKCGSRGSTWITREGGTYSKGRILGLTPDSDLKVLRVGQGVCIL